MIWGGFAGKNGEVLPEGTLLHFYTRETEDFERPRKFDFDTRVGPNGRVRSPMIPNGYYRVYSEDKSFRDFVIVDGIGPRVHRREPLGE